MTDGAYAGTGNTELAPEKNIELVPTDLIGRKPDPINFRFEMNEDGTRIVKCPAGYEPKSCSYDRRSGQCHVSFDRDKCAGCPFRDQCHPKIYKRVAKKVISRENVARAAYIESKGTDRFFFGGKIGALNVRKYLRFLAGGRTGSGSSLTRAPGIMLSACAAGRFSAT